jgi:NADH-quinone oxidoreductase subunit M
MTLLDVLIALPLAGFLLLLVLPRASEANSRLVALVISLAIFVASLGLLVPFLNLGPGTYFETDGIWIASPVIRYHVALDGLSLWLVILSTLLTPICVLISWTHIRDRLKEYYAFLLLLEFGVIGVFVAQDLFLFYVFWEATLVPMYF